MTSRTCPQCGAPLPGSGAEWLCPKCLFGQAASSTFDGATPSLETELSPFGDRPVLHYFGDYELLHEIARGGMGVVYKARQISLNRVVAVKMLLFGKLAGDDFVKRFRAEAEAAASLQHSNIVAIHEVGEHEGQQYFSMDYVAGSDLGELVRVKPLSAERAGRYLKTVAEAIHYAHDKNILHRDLKPSNILIDAYDQPRVTDFGLAKRLTADPQLTVTGQVLGTPGFMSPEQSGGRRGGVGTASDVYSLGALLYFLLTGRAPFAAESLEETLRQVHEAEPVSPRLINRNVPSDLETICLKCLSKEPQGRYATAKALAEDLGRWLLGETIMARPASVVEKAWSWCRRRPAVATPLAVLLLLLVAVAVGSFIAAARINRERAQAEAQAKKSRQVSQFLKDMFSGLSPSIALGRDTTLLREILHKAEARLSTELHGLPDVEAELRDTIGTAYLHLTEFAKAEAMHEEALRLRQSHLGEEHPDTVDTLFHLFLDHWHGGEWQFERPRPDSLLRRAFDLHVKVNGSNNLRTATLLNYFGMSAKAFEEAEAFFRRSLVILHELNETNNSVYGSTLEALGMNLRYQDRLVEAESMGRQSVAALRRLQEAGRPATAHTLYELALTLREAGKLQDAESAARESWFLSQHLYGATNAGILVILSLAATTAFERGDLAGSDALLADAPLHAILDTTGRQFGGEEERFWLVRTLTALGWHQWSLRQASRAQRYADQAEGLGEKFLALRLKEKRKVAWRVANARSVFGGTLVVCAVTHPETSKETRLAKLAQAERLLLDGNEGLRTSSDPSAARLAGFRREALQRLIRLHEIWDTLAPEAGHAAQTAEWQAKLATFDQAKPR